MFGCDDASSSDDVEFSDWIISEEQKAVVA